MLEFLVLILVALLVKDKFRQHNSWMDIDLLYQDPTLNHHSEPKKTRRSRKSKVFKDHIISEDSSSHQLKS